MNGLILILVLKNGEIQDLLLLISDSIEEIQILLDDHIVKTQTMKGSPYSKSFIDDIRDWENWLLYNSSCIEIWQLVQSSWIYLEPIMGNSEEILNKCQVKLIC